MTIALHSPRGFVAPNTTRFHGVEKGLQEVDDLLALLRAKPSDNWKYHRRLIDAAKNLCVGDQDRIGLSSWLAFLVEHDHPQMTWLHYSFIDDTIHYLLTGYRRVSPATMITLLETNNVENVTVAQRAELVKKRNEIKQHLMTLDQRLNEDFIWTWLRQPNGVNDLTYTLYLLYGSLSGNTQYDPFMNIPTSVIEV